MTRRPVPQRDLFGPPKTPPRDVTPVEIPMREASAGTDKAWHLAPLGASSKLAAFAPRSEVARAPEPASHLFTMPRWIARERGWL